MGSEMIPSPRGHNHSGSDVLAARSPHASSFLNQKGGSNAKKAFNNFGGSGSNPDLNKNESYLTRLDRQGRGSMAVANTGATSGAILTDGVSGFETRKRSI